MFRPNQNGKLFKIMGRDVHSRPTYGAPIVCQFAPVNLAVSTEKTNVRADSSASRGSADELISTAKILIVPQVKPDFEDAFEFLDVRYRVIAVHPRYTVTGALDHYEVDLGVLPQ